MADWWAAALAGLVGWLALFPPELLKVGDGYAAKIVCSNVSSPDAIPGSAGEDVQAPGHPLLKLVRVSVDQEEQSVTARILGFAAPGRAVYRPGHGCANVSGAAPRPLQGCADRVATAPLAHDPGADWPDGDKPDIDVAIQMLVEDPALAGPGMRAIVVVRDGRLVAETYAAGFDRNTPLLGWSMTSP